jgi:hypothetical protein
MQFNFLFVDTCCNNRKVLEEIFGVPIKLDVFHGLSRVLRQLKSGDLLNGPDGRGQRTKFIREVRLIIRQEHDQGEKRKLETASADMIQNNISQLLDRWSGKLKTEIIKELKALRDKHSVCLSGVPPGVGTHRNEQLHSKINAFHHSIKNMSLQMEIALVETLLYRHNQKIDPVIDISLFMKMQKIILQRPPSLQFQDGLGILTSNIIVAIQSEDCEDIGEPNVASAKNLVSVLQNIVPRSLNYKGIEMLCCCPFQSNSFNLSKSEIRMDEEQKMKQFIFDLGMETFSESTNWMEAIQESAGHAQTIKGNVLFQEYANLVFSNSWELLVSQQLSKMNGHFIQYFSGQEEATLYQKRFLENTVLSHDTIECTFQLCSNILKSVIIILSSSSNPVQTVYPMTEIVNGYPLVIASLSGASMFLSVRQTICDVPSASVNSDSMRYENANICTCGKGRSSDTPSCSLNSRCPCIKSKQSCANCKCINCCNTFGVRYATEKQKTKSCRCGAGAKAESNSYCISSRCVCYACRCATAQRAQCADENMGKYEKT